jgi:hypothetical protein
MPRRAKHVEANELARVEGSIEVGVERPIEPLADRPLRVGVVLRLDREQVSDDLARRRQPLPDEPLGGEPSDRDRVGGQLSRAP